MIRGDPVQTLAPQRAGRKDEPPDPPPGVRLRPVDRSAEDLLDVFHKGYHPGHIDVVEGEDVEAELAQLIEESIPEASALAVADEQVVGVILVDSQRLILTVFRDPAPPRHRRGADPARAQQRPAHPRRHPRQPRRAPLPAARLQARLRGVLSRSVARG